MSSCSRLTASGLVMIDRLRFREHRTVRQIAAVIGRIVHRQPRVEAQPVEPVQRERVVPPVQSRALEDRSVDRRAVLLRAGRATPSRQAAPPIPARVFGALPPAARTGRTWDNGSESALHLLVDESTGMPAYPPAV